MTTDRLVARANRWAADLLDAYWDGALPVPLRPIADALGATMLQAHLETGVRSVIVGTPFQTRIVVSRHLDARGRRLQAAHALGHVVEYECEGAGGEYGRVCRDTGATDPRERFADTFAHALLRPAVLNPAPPLSTPHAITERNNMHTTRVTDTVFVADPGYPLTARTIVALAFEQYDRTPDQIQATPVTPDEILVTPAMPRDVAERHNQRTNRAALIVPTTDGTGWCVTFSATWTPAD